MGEGRDSRETRGSYEEKEKGRCACLIRGHVLGKCVVDGACEWKYRARGVWERGTPGQMGDKSGEERFTSAHSLLALSLLREGSHYVRLSAISGRPGTTRVRLFDLKRFPVIAQLFRSPYFNLIINYWTASVLA